MRHAAALLLVLATTVAAAQPSGGRKQPPTFDALTDAIGRGQPDTVDSLLAAGLPLGGTDAARANMAVVNALATACATASPPPGVGDALSVLARHGLQLDRADENGNTILMSSAQFCPAPITQNLLRLGAKPDPVNKQDFTPLQMALVAGKWDTAEILIDAGAKLTKAQIGQIFFEPPQKQAQRDLLARATR